MGQEMRYNRNSGCIWESPGKATDQDISVTEMAALM